MALKLRSWIVGVLLGCLAIAVATGGRQRVARRPVVGAGQSADPAVRAMLRQRELVGRRILTTERALFFLSWRDSVLGKIPTDTSGRLALLPYRKATPADNQAFSTLAARYHDAVGSHPALAVAVVLIPDSLPVHLPDTGRVVLHSRGGVVLPGATGNRSCLVLVTPRTILERELGACVYFAAFGLPGKHVHDWLQRQRFNQSMGWNWTEASPRPAWGQIGASPQPILRIVALASGSLPPQYYAGALLTGCLHGNPAGCREAVLGSSPLPGGDLWQEGPLLGAGPLAPGLQQYLLSDMVHSMGPARFRSFWQSPLPVDSAFQVAAGVPLVRWAHDWLALRAPLLRSGPGIAGWTVPVWFLFIAAFLAAAVRSAERREVR